MSGWELRRPVQAGRLSLRRWLSDTGHAAAQRLVGEEAAPAKVTEREMS